MSLEAQNKKKDIYYQGEINFFLGLSSRWVDLGLETVHGVCVKPWLMFGVGIGYHHWFKARGGEDYPDIEVLPVYGNIKLYLVKWERATPFLSMDAGYAFEIGGAKQGGMYLSPSIGIDFPSWNKVSQSISLGYSRIDLYDEFAGTFLIKYAFCF